MYRGRNTIPEPPYPCHQLLLSAWFYFPPQIFLQLMPDVFDGIGDYGTSVCSWAAHRACGSKSARVFPAEYLFRRSTPRQETQLQLPLDTAVPTLDASPCIVYLWVHESFGSTNYRERTSRARVCSVGWLTKRGRGLSRAGSCEALWLLSHCQCASARASTIVRTASVAFGRRPLPRALFIEQVVA